MGDSKASPGKASPFATRVQRLSILLLMAIFLGGVLAVPYYYETQTLWYKAGTDKLMLRTGQQAGLLALVLLVLQIILSIQGHFLAKLFGGANLLRWHRVNGVLVACAALSHVLLVLAPEGFNNLPTGMKYWPEMIGGALFFLLLVTVLSSHFRAALKLDYKKWRTLHRFLGYLALVLVLLHVLFVSESFERGAPRVVLLSVFAGLALWVAVAKRGQSRPKS